jgi:hypothetical protein
VIPRSANNVSCAAIAASRWLASRSLARSVSASPSSSLFEKIEPGSNVGSAASCGLGRVGAAIGMGGVCVLVATAEGSTGAGVSCGLAAAAAGSTGAGVECAGVASGSFDTGGSVGCTTSSTGAASSTAACGKSPPMTGRAFAETPRIFAKPMYADPKTSTPATAERA